MAIAGFITFLGLLIAAYSILKPHEKLYIRLRFSLLDKVLIPLIVTCIFMAIILSDHIKAYDREITFLKYQFRLSFLISASAYIFLFLIGIYFTIKINLNRLSRRKLNLFYKLTKELLNKREYPALVEILDDEYSRLIRYSSRLPWHNEIINKVLSFFSLKSVFRLPPEELERLRKILNESGEEHIIEKNRPSRISGGNKFLLELSADAKHYIGKLLRCFLSEVRDNSSSKRSRYMLHTMLSNNEFVSEMIALKPELGLKMFKNEFPNYFEYIDIFFYELIKNNKSILYYELKNNQNERDYHRYAVPEENMILAYLFTDCRVAQRLQVYRGIGDYVLEYLLDLSKQEVDLDNYEYENFENRKWKSPIFIGIRFFDIMVTEAIYQGIRDHMWLYYFHYFTEYIFRNFKYIPRVWEGLGEWHSGYGYLLYEIVHTLCHWIEIILYGRFSYPVELLKDDDSHENANIIKSSIICLIQVLELVAGDIKVPDLFKRQQADRVIKLLFDLKTSDSEATARYGNALFACIKFYTKFPGKLNKPFFELMKYTYDKFDDTHYTIGKKKEKGAKLAREMEEYFTSIPI